MAWRSSTRSVLLAALLLAGCDLFGDDPVPTTITVTPTALELDAVGEVRSLMAEVLDQDGRAMSSPGLTWTTSNAAVVTVDGDGVVTSQGNGSATVVASGGRASAEIAVTVAQTVSSITLISGGGQAGAAGEALPEAVTVLARDRNSHLARGAALRFVAVSGEGSFDPAVATTDPQGLARSTWVLGSVAGSPQLARVDSGEGPDAVSISLDAAAVAGAPDEARILSGDGQAAPRSGPLPEPLVVRVLDRFENPVSDLPVTFQAETGGGSFEPETVLTDADGRVSTLWTLGATLGLQAGRILVQGLTPVPFTATALPVPTALVAVEGDGQTAPVGTPVPTPPAVRVEDLDGSPVVGLTVRFSVEEGGGSVTGDVAVTDAGGVARVEAWTLGPLPGENRLRASVDGLPPVDFTATAEVGPPGTLVRVSGSGQAGVPGTPLSSPLRVRVLDSHGNGVPGVTVEFRLQQAGALSAPSAVTGPGGIAEVTWTLGPGGEYQTATAFTLAPTLPEVRFVAAVSDVPSSYSITLRYVIPAPPHLELMAERAAARWATLITGDIADVTVRAPAGVCGMQEPALDETLDDLLVWVRIEPIDGPSGILGGASRCAVRVVGGLPAIGVVRLDSDDLDRISASMAAELILHELGHTLGIGTVWKDQDFASLLVNPSLPNSPGVDTHFRGPEAIAAFDALGGAAYAGAKVPVENQQGGQGTRDSHWRESVLQSELMTGFLSAAGNPLSRITVASLRDLGYEVNPAAADAFTVPLPAAFRVPEEGGLDLGDDILRIPLRVLNDRGEVIRVIPPDPR